jgi:group II intron reverse transcriptase/maturase
MGQLIERILDAENMRKAWDEMSDNKGIPGVDHVSIKQWRRKWEERLVELAADVRANRYKPAKLRLRRIPKKKRGEWRVLRIPTVTDRVLQRAALQVLHGLYERRFLDCSFGYRPGRGLRDAVQRIVALRERGLTFVLDADIDAFFDEVDHELLLSLVREDIDDPVLLQLIEGWLEVGRVKPDTAKGIPMGSPISPLLANVYLHPLDCALNEAGWEMARYADDFVSLTRTRQQAEAVYAEVEEQLSALKLRYEPHKTSITSFEEGFDFLGVHFYRDTYTYNYKNKTIEVDGDEVDWLFSRYGPDY